MTTIRQRAEVPLSAAGRRFDQALAEMFPDYSRSRLSGWIKAGAVTLDGVAAAPRQLLRGGEQVALEVELATEVHSRPEAISLDIVHEDRHLLVLNKPAGLVVHPGAGNPAGTLLNGLLHHDPTLAELPRAGIVHRLDKDTSGLMVVARTRPCPQPGAVPIGDRPYPSDSRAPGAHRSPADRRSAVRGRPETAQGRQRGAGRRVARFPPPGAARRKAVLHPSGHW